MAFAGRVCFDTGADTGISRKITKFKAKFTKTKMREKRNKRRQMPQVGPLRDASVSGLAWRDWLAPIFLFAVAVSICLPAVHGDWLYDDKYAIQKNPLLREWGGIWRIWSSFGKIPLESHYWPMTYSLLWLERLAWSERQTGFHLVNFALHGLVVIRIWRLGRRIGLPGAALGAALFAVHPVHVEAVAWVISVKDLLAALFYLVALECYLNFEERGWTWLIFAAIAAAAAMFGKSSPVMLPAGIALLAWYRRGTLRRRDWAGVGAIASVTFSIAALDFLLGWMFNPHSDGPQFADRLVQAGRAFWFYLQKLAWPVGLGPIYPQWDFNASNVLDWLPLAAIAALTLVLWAMRPRIGRGPLAIWLFYGITLGPALGLIHFDFLDISPAADRYQYLASIGPLAGLGALSALLLEKTAPRRRYPILACFGLALAALAGMSWRQAGFYRDQEALFSHAKLVAPQSAFVRYNLGVTYQDKKDYLNAEREFAAAVKLQPDYWQAVSNLGAVLVSEKKLVEAVEVFSRATDRGCPEPIVYCNLVSLQATSLDPRVYNPAHALKVARKLAQTFGGEPRSLAVLAMAEAANGQTAQAAVTARKALDLAKKRHETSLVKQLEAMISRFDKGQALRM